MSDRPVLTITLEEGGVKVEGPINDKMLCYALLGAAHDAVKDFTDELRKPKIAIPSTTDIISLGDRRVQ